MLRLIAGLEEATLGAIELDGKDVTDLTAAERGLAMVFQSYALYPHKTVRDNMAFPLRVAGKSKKEAYEKVDQAADILQLGPLLDRKPKELSGGQRQRVAIGRCIVREPAAFLFDEPLSNLDAALRVQMRVEIARLHRQLDATMIYVTHDQVEAMTLANRIVVFSAGRIEQIGTPLELYTNPGNLFVATFIGSPKMNILDLDTNGNGLSLNGTPIASARNLGEGRPVKLGIRPEHVTLSAAGQGGLEGIVGVTEHLGSDSFYHVDMPGLGSVVARADLTVGLREGDKAGLSFDPEQVHLFDENGQAITRAAEAKGSA